MFPNIPEDDTFIGTGGDASDNLGGEAGRYDFKMDSSKVFEITISSTEIPIHEFKFESGDNGHVEVSKIDKNETSIETAILKSGESKIIKMTDLMLSSYTIKAKAVGKDKYMLQSWDITNPITPPAIATVVSEEITMDATMDGNIFKANFIIEEFISINFEAGEGGNITITTEKDGVPISTQVIQSGESNAVEIGESKFKPDYVITAVAEALANYAFYDWETEYIIPPTPETRVIAENSLIISREMKEETFKASFNSSKTSAVTFETTKGGSIKVSIVRKSDNRNVMDITINNDTEDSKKTVNISDTMFLEEYTITATAIADTGYLFNKGWRCDGELMTDATEEIIINGDSKYKVYKVNFVEETRTFTFAAKMGGKISVTIKDNKDGTVLDTLNIEERDNESIEISKNQFVTNTFTVLAIADDVNGYVFDAWEPATYTKDTFDLSYTMTGDSFTAKFAEQITFNFEASANGSIQVDKVLKASPNTRTPLATIDGGNTGTTGTVKMKNSDFPAYQIEATPKPKKEFKFKEWNTFTSSEVLVIKSHTEETIKATFVPMVVINLNFKVGSTLNVDDNGYIDVIVFDGNTKLSNKRIAAGGDTYSVSLKEYLFKNPYKVEARAEGLAGYVIDKWDDGVKDGTRQIVTTNKTSYTATFKYKDIEYGTPSTSLKKEGDWYLISSKEDLLYLANKINWDGSDAEYRIGKYKIMNDIDYGGAYHKPIGAPGSDEAFKGVINGNNKVIKNAKYGMSTYRYSTMDYPYFGLRYISGFIGYMENATISNLTIDKSVEINTGVNTGGIVGGGSGNIINCVNKANITVYNNTNGVNVGGILGYGSGVVSNVYNSGNIEVDSIRSYIGGIWGGGVSGTLVNAYNTGSIYYSGDWSILGQTIYGRVGGISSQASSSSSHVLNVYSSARSVYDRFANQYVGAILGYYYNADLKNAYFVGNYFINGFGMINKDDKSDRTVNNAGGWEGVFRAFKDITNAAGKDVWIVGPDGGRPIIKGLPAE